MKLRPYQEAGRDFLASRQFALLADEMRVGKTPQAILAADKIGARKILVVCPAIAVQHWWNEWQKWSANRFLSGLRIVSFDKLRLQHEALLSERYDVTIVDECHFAGNPEAQRTQLIYGERGIGWCSKRLWCLSGTPAKKSAAELWPMFIAFGVTKMDYRSFWRYYCTYDPLTDRITGTKLTLIPELRAMLAKVMLRRTREQVAPEMPAIGYEFLEIIGASYPDYANLDVLNDETAADGTRQEIAASKVGPLADEIEFALDNGLLKQTVVFGWHTAPLSILAAMLFERSITVGLIHGQTPDAQRTSIQSRFRGGELQVVVGNILAAGTAIDLSAASHGYFVELDWLPANNQQAANRLISLEKLEPVTFDIATRPGTVDDAVQRILLRRTRELDTLLLAGNPQEIA